MGVEDVAAVAFTTIGTVAVFDATTELIGNRKKKRKKSKSVYDDLSLNI